MTMEELVILVSVSMEGFLEELSHAQQGVQKFAKEAEKTTEDTAKKQQDAWKLIGDEMGKIFTQIVGSVQKGIEASNAYNTAIQSLGNTASANGIGSEEMQTALKAVTDEFFDATAASAAFKNLLSRGYTLEQATQSILHLKDAAAYGREAQLSLKDAVVGATEGLKNENGSLVENAGVTQKITKMWEQYAKVRGISTDSMTQSMKVEAEYLGIMKATAMQAGDLQEYSDGLAGSQAKAAEASTMLAVSFGDAMTPVVQASADAFTGLMQTLAVVAEGAPNVTAGVTTMTGAFAGLTMAMTGLQALKSLFGVAGALSGMLGPLAGIAAVVGVIAGISAAIERNKEEQIRKEKERIDGLKQSVENEQNKAKELEQIGARYDELSKKSSLSLSETAEMARMRKTLADAYGIEAAGVSNAAAAHFELAAAIEAEIAASQKKAYDSQNQLTVETREAAIKSAVPLLEEEIELRQQLDMLQSGRIDMDAKATVGMINQLGVLEDYGVSIDSLFSHFDTLSGLQEEVTMGDLLENALTDAQFEAVKNTKFQFSDALVSAVLSEMENVRNELDAVMPKFSEWFVNDFLRKGMELESEGTVVPEGLMNSFVSAITKNFDKEMLTSLNTADPEEIKSAINETFLEPFVEAARDGKFLEAVEGFQGVAESALRGLAPSETQKEFIRKSWGGLLGEDGPIMQTLAIAQEKFGTENGAEFVNTFVQFLLGLPEGFELFNESGQLVIQTSDEMIESFTTEAEACKESAEAAREKAAADKEAAQNMNDMKIKSQTLDDGLRRAKGMAQNVKDAKDAIAAYKGLTKEQKKSEDEIKKVSKAVGGLGFVFDGSAESLASIEKGLDNLGPALAQQAQSMEAELNGLIHDFETLDGVKDVHGNLTANGQLMADEIAAREKDLLILKGLMLALGFTVGDGKGGGGGGKKKDEAEEAAKKAEEARKEAIRKDYETIDHKRHLNEITLEEELALLEKIRVNHQLNAEEIMDWERKIYDLKKELRERDEESIEKLGDSVVDALEARYEAMRDAELDRLDESRKAWEQWRDDSVKAIEDQIAALDKLADTEDREKKDAEELRKIAKIKQEIEFERDDYNRAKLQQQLESAIAAREERLRRLELEDQKEALREQIEGIEEKADAELDLLDKEEEKINAAYEERLKDAALRAEAEKLILTKSQDELLALLKEYAPEYDALGKTMGEKLVDGFQQKVGDIVSWFENFNNAMVDAQNQWAQEIINTMDHFQQQHSQRQSAPAPTPAPTIINNTTNFYEPVETPSQVARRIEQVNEELAVLLA